MQSTETTQGLESSQEPGTVQAAESALDQLYRLLRRVTWSTQYMAALDGFRFLAILGVVLFHLHDRLPRSVEGGVWIQALFRCGNIGVQVFFVISGFVLALPFLRQYVGDGKPLGLRQYFLRRLVRLEPTYLINLVLLVFVFGVYAKCRQLPPSLCGCGNDYAHLGWSALYLHGAVVHQFSFVNYVAWSLEVEVQFYVLMPVFAWLFFRIRRTWLRRLAMVLFCVPFWVYQTLQHQGNFPHGIFLFDQIQYFFAGILLADIFLHDWTPQQREGQQGHWWFDGLSLLSWLAIPGVLLFSRYYARFVMPVLIFVALYASLRSVRVRKVFAFRWIAVFGGMCYTIYLYHPFLLHKIIPYVGGFSFTSYWMNLFLVMPFVLLGVFGLSAVLFLLFEKPFMALVWGITAAKKSPRAGGER